MSLRDRDPRPGLPTSHYFFSLSRGDSIRTFVLRPAAVWALAALAPLSLAWGAAATAYLALHDDLMGAIVVRQVEMQTAYEDRLAEARAQLDVVASRQLLDQNSFEGKMHELLSRQARLEQRGSIVAALASEASGPKPLPFAARSAGSANLAPDALGAIQSLSRPKTSGGDGDGSARAYAPAAGVAIEPRTAKPRSVDQKHENLSVLTGDLGAPALASLTAAAESPDLDAAARLNLIGRSLDRMESGQMITLAAIDRTATRASARDAAIVAQTGLDPMKLAAPRGAEGVGGPYIPVDVDPKAPGFDHAAARVARDVALTQRLRALMPFMPLRKPLDGEFERHFAVRVPDRSFPRPSRASSGRRSRRSLRGRHPVHRRRPRHPCRADGRLRNHGRDRSRKRPDDPLRAHVRSPGRGGPGGGAGCARRPDRLHRPLDRPAFALRGARRRRTGRSGALSSRWRATSGGGIRPRQVPFYRACR